MPLDDASAGHDKAGGVEPETMESPGGFAHEHALVPTRRPGDVTEPLDRMHPRDATATLGRVVLARYRLQPWRATRDSIPN